MVGEDKVEGKHGVKEETFYTVASHLNNIEAMIIAWILNLARCY